jgi:hypothetical protein
MEIRPLDYDTVIVPQILAPAPEKLFLKLIIIDGEVEMRQTLISVPHSDELISLIIDKAKAISNHQHDNWSVEFEDDGKTGKSRKDFKTVKVSDINALFHHPCPRRKAP